jgi:UDP-glucose 4-epimerase
MVERTVVVTGGAGFIGSALVRALLRDDWKVIVYDSLNPGRADFLPESDDVHLVQGNILDEAAFGALLDAHKPEIVFHLAAIHYIPYCNAHPQDAMNTNVDGTEVVFRLSRAAGVRRVVFASTAAVYPPHTGPLSETLTPAAPMDIYGYTKWFGEQLADWMGRQGGTEFVLARFFNAYGPRETSPHLIPSVLKQIIEGQTTISVGNIEPKRDYVFVDDLAKCLTLLGAIPVPSETGVVRANIGTGSEYSVRDVLETLRSATGAALEIRQDPSRMRASDRPNLLADTQQLKSLIGWTPDTPFFDGMRGLVEWARANPELMVG